MVHIIWITFGAIKLVVMRRALRRTTYTELYNRKLRLFKGKIL